MVKVKGFCNEGEMLSFTILTSVIPHNDVNSQKIILNTSVNNFILIFINCTQEADYFKKKTIN